MQSEPKPAPTEADHRKAQSIAFAIRKLSWSLPSDARWLAEYEAKYGRVKP